MAPTHHTAKKTGRCAAALVAVLALSIVASARGMVLDEGERKGLLNVRKGFRFVDVIVEGNQEMFLANNKQYSSVMGGGGSFAQTLRVDVDMEVLPNFTVRGKFDDTLNPAKQELAVEYHGDQLNFVAGDVQAGFSGTEFPMEAQQLFGARGKFQDGPHTISAVAAHLTGAAGHFAGKGDNTRGPYFMPDKKLIPNSERVYVDAVRKLRGGDYSIDYLTGVINFTQPVDERFRISVDYEYEPIIPSQAQNMFVSRYAGEITTSASLGISAGTRRGSDGDPRNLVGFDGRMNLDDGTSLGGEVALAKQGQTMGEAVRGDLAGQLDKGTWNASVRAVTPDYSGLSSTTSRRDAADASVGFTYPWDKDLRLTTHFSTSRDNLGNAPDRPVIRDFVQDNGAVWTLPSQTRLELTFDNRNELHRDDLAVHQLDSFGTSFRFGSRYRLEKHMLRASYEVRATDDLAGVVPRKSLGHVLNSQVQSQLFGQIFSTETLQYTHNPDSQEVLSGIDFASPLFEYLGSNVSYTLQHRMGAGAGDTHSAAMTLRAQKIENLSAESTLQLKRAVPLAGLPTGNAIVSGRLGYALGTRATLSADVQKTLAQTSSRGPTTMEIRGSYRPSKEWDFGGGYRVDQLDDPHLPTQSYQARVGYMEFNLTF